MYAMISKYILHLTLMTFFADSRIYNYIAIIYEWNKKWFGYKSKQVTSYNNQWSLKSTLYNKSVQNNI